MNSKEGDGWGQPNIAITSDDTLWVATVKGLARLDRQRFQRTNHKPAIYMEEVEVGRTKGSPGRELVLPPGTRGIPLYCRRSGICGEDPPSIPAGRGGLV